MALFVPLFALLSESSAAMAVNFLLFEFF